jgi:AcrR family transcriptional regulator
MDAAPTAGGTRAGRARREQILEAASRLFSEQGYHGTSMRDLAEATGILRGSLYAHIRAKEDLLFEIVLRAAEAFLGSLGEVAGSDATPERKLREAMRAHVRVVSEDPDAARVFHHEWRALGEPRLAEARALRDRYESLWERIVTEGLRTGTFHAPDPRAVRLLVLGAANWTYTWYDPQGPLTPDQVADRFTDLVVRGLRPRGKIRGSEVRA